MNSSEKLRQFVSALDMNHWYRMDEKERLNLLQEYENILAEMAGRPPMPVKVMPDEYINSISGVAFGYYSSEEKVICINPKFLTSRKSILGVSNFELPRVLETIAHEGRHAWQDYVVEHPEEKLVDQKTRLAILMNNYCYCSANSPNLPFSAYEGQLIELDARRFAREILQQMSTELEKRDGHLDPQFVATIRKANMRENNLAARLIREISEADLLAYDELARQRMKAVCPGVDFSGISMFSEAAAFLRDRDMQKFTEGTYIRSAAVRLKADRFRPTRVGSVRSQGFRETKRHKLL